MFERSKSGQENRAVFFGVNAICYVEGGGGQSDSAADITFWAQVFTTCRPDIAVKCIPRGGKPILETLAQDIISKNLRNTYVAMDADYDQYAGEIIADRRVLYTYGYSWENDLFSLENLFPTYQALAHVAAVGADVRSFISTEFSRAVTRLRWPMAADFMAMNAKSSVLPRQAPGRIVAVDNGTGLPVIRMCEAIKLCGMVNEQTKPRHPCQTHGKMDLHRHCVGHIFAAVALHVIRAALRAFHKKMAISSDHLRDVALQTMHQMLVGANAVAAHHRAQAANVDA